MKKALKHELHRKRSLWLLVWRTNETAANLLTFSASVFKRYFPQNSKQTQAIFPSKI